MAYQEITQYNSPNYTPASQVPRIFGKARTIDGVVYHWWGDPNLKPTFQGIINYLCRPNGNTSAHVVGEAGRIAWIINAADSAWHAGNAYANSSFIGYECNPRLSDGDYETMGEFHYDLEKAYGKRLAIHVHKEFSSTQCFDVDKTELLTPSGWKKLRDIKKGEKVATAHIDDLSIEFDNVLSVVKPHRRDSWFLRDFEATHDHRMLYSLATSKGTNRVAFWNDLYNSDTKTVYLPNAGSFSGKGLPLTDEEIELLVAVQADGYYMKRYDSADKRIKGVGFHLKKDRKIKRITSLLDNLGIEYTINVLGDGTTNIRSYGKGLYNWCEKFLKNKNFTWDWINLSPDQAKKFLDLLLDYDGCRANNSYSSYDKINIDIVYAIASLNNVGTRGDSKGNRVYFTDKYRSLPPKNKDVKRVKKQTHEVGCVSVRSGFILVRQHGRTIIVGNCSPIDKGRIRAIADRFHAGQAQKVSATPAPTKKAVPAPEKFPTPRRFKVKIDKAELWDLESNPNWKSVKSFPRDTALEFAGVYHFNGSVYYTTAYSMSRGIKTGVNAADLEEIAVKAPEPAPAPAPKEDPEWVKNLKDILITKLTVVQPQGVKVINLLTGETIGDKIPVNTQIDVRKITTVGGKEYYISSYASDKGVPHGLPKESLAQRVEPLEKEKPEWLNNLHDIEDQDFWTRGKTTVFEIKTGKVAEILSRNKKVRITHTVHFLENEFMITEDGKAILPVMLSDKPVENDKPETTEPEIKELDGWTSQFAEQLVNEIKQSKDEIRQHKELSKENNGLLKQILEIVQKIWKAFTMIFKVKK